MEFLDQIIYNNTVERWALVVGTILGVLLVLRVLKALVIKRLERMADRSQTVVDDMLVLVLARTNTFLFLLMFSYFGSLALQLPEQIRIWVGTVAVVALVVQAWICADAAIEAWLNNYKKRTLSDNAARYTTVRTIGYTTRFILLVVSLLVALDNIPGIEITPLLASLGVAGIAVALALQNILDDLFASITIALDKPFVINDFIIVGEYMGTVESIGIKTTRLRSLSGEQLVFENSDLLGSRIRNYQRMAERRIVFHLGVTYDTPYAKLQRIPEIVQQIIEAHENARFDRVHFASYGDSALTFEVVYYVLSADYNVYMDVQQDINLAIYQAFEETAIEFAYPTQTLYLARTGITQGSGSNGSGAQQTQHQTNN